MMSVAVATPVAPTYLVPSVNTPTPLKVVVERALNVRLDPEIDAMAFGTDCAALNGALSGTLNDDCSVNGTESVSPSTHAYPDVEIELAVQWLGTLITGRACENNVVVNPSGADTVTVNLTENELRGTVVPSLYDPIDTECPDASYV